MDLTNWGVAYLENVMPAPVKANMAMKERLKSPASESMMTNSSPPPLSQYPADDGPLPCTSSLHFNDCSGTADDFASAPDRTTSETAMSLVKPLEDLTDEILSALCLCLQRKQCGCWARVTQANLASTKSRWCNYTTIQLLTVDSGLMIEPRDEQYLPSPEDWMCTPDGDLAHGIVDEQADDNPAFQ